MKEKLSILALALALALPLGACAPNVPETASPTPHATATPGGAMDDLKDAGEDMAEDIGDAARKVTDDVKDGVSRALR